MTTHYDEADIGERDIPSGNQAGAQVELTPESVIAFVSVNSPAGSGTAVFSDFGTAVRQSWALGLEEGYAEPVNGAPVPPTLLEGRRAFKALLDRYEREGYQPGRAEELDTLNRTYCDAGYAIDIVHVLPNDLEDVLELCFPDDDREEWPEGVPEHADFDLDNPVHMALLEQRLKELVEY